MSETKKSESKPFGSSVGKAKVEKEETAVYLSTEYLGLSITLKPATYEYHEVTKAQITIPGKVFKFNNGKLFLNKKEDIELMDEILSGYRYGVPMPPPPGVFKVKKSAIDIAKKLSEETEESEDVRAIQEVENRASGNRGRQGAVGRL